MRFAVSCTGIDIRRVHRLGCAGGSRGYLEKKTKILQTRPQSENQTTIGFDAYGIFTWQIHSRMVTELLPVYMYWEVGFNLR